MQVSKKVMSLASKPFAEMFSLQALESRTLGVDGLPIVAFDGEDPAEAL